ncbi:hypothetical protein AUK04_03505 [Candidatus Roizmanbacteria bacterium CG2_30_33_16]|uniref:Nudix hydrolase domain-containing protein n=2 Tax=Candidatus Roizmaniibacteriota TaxID=1752723 RepID=A0A2M8DC05_9BACT|nr:NUDIX hydrolase [Candidatus Roizmanbacteria bacterium]OIP83372.1 MAG: hypothetical protein AUK04_03505 [Candidatus Roizmanbacteria bacterium CG2_30_33_16]PJB87933.1 MAG: hypothetical protein CO083_04415 [Candidatus Roizmanbacteria bacterium CG_4_9_14_0_8_um_filter_34_12]
MKKPTKTLSSKSIYQNKFVEVKVDKVESDKNTWEQVYFVKPNKNSVGIIPMDNSGIYLVNQYRYASKEYLWQIPMGMIDKANNELETAKIELREEVGLTAKKFTRIGSFIAEPGMSPQATIIFVAEGLDKVKNNPDLSEVNLQAKHFSFEQIDRKVKEGDIKCGFTLSSLIWLKSSDLFNRSRLE